MCVLEFKTHSWIYTEATHTANFTNLECRVTKLRQMYNPHPYQTTEYNHHSTVILCVPSRWPHCQRQSLLLAYRTETDSCNLTQGLISNRLKQLTALLRVSVSWDTIHSLSTYSLPHTEQARDDVIIISLNQKNNFHGGENHEINYTSWVTWMHNQWEATHHALHLLFGF